MVPTRGVDQGSLVHPAPRTNRALANAELPRRRVRSSCACSSSRARYLT